MSKKSTSPWADQVDISENAERNGLELHFNAQPHPELQSKLRVIGFRPGKRQGFWYADADEKVRDFADELKSVLAQKPEGPVVLVNPTYEVSKNNVEKKDYSYVMITLKSGEIKNYLVFEPSKPKAETIATNFARKEFGENFQSLAVKPRMHIREARMLFEEGKVIQPGVEPEIKKNIGKESSVIEEPETKKVPVQSILVTASAISRNPDYGKGKEFSQWSDANRFVRELIGLHADAYYKVCWQDDESIEGMMDLQPASFYDGKENVLSEHIRTFYTYLSNHTPDILYGKKAVEFARHLIHKYQLFDESQPEKISSRDEAFALGALNRWLDSNVAPKDREISRKDFDAWFNERYPNLRESNLDAIWKVHQKTQRTLKRLKIIGSETPKIQPYHSIYNKLLKVIPGLNEFLEQGVLSGKSRLDSDAMMDLNFDYLGKDKNGNYLIALSHYYKQNGDMIPDPDMEIRVMPELEAAEALSYKDSFGFKDVYREVDGKEMVDLRRKKDQNSFLNQWLTNLIKQGHKIDLSLSDEESEESEEAKEEHIKAYGLLEQFIPGILAQLDGMQRNSEESFEAVFPDKRFSLSIEKSIGREAKFFIIQYSSDQEEEIQYDVEIDADKSTAHATFEWLNFYYLDRYDRDEDEDQINERDGDIGEEIDRAFTEFLEDVVHEGYKIDLTGKKQEERGTSRYNYTVKGATGELEFNPLIMAHYIMESPETLLYSIYGSRFDRGSLNGRSFSPEEILFLKNIFIEYVLTDKNAEALYREVYQKESDRKYDLHSGNYSEEVNEKNEREKNGWIHTLSERNAVKADFLKLGLSPRMNGKEAFARNVPVIDLVYRYDEIYAEYELKIEGPLRSEIGKLNKKIKSLKESKSKASGENIKKLKEEITQKENEIQKTFRVIEDETLVFQDEVWDEMRSMAFSMGFKLYDPLMDIVAIRDEIMLGLFDNRVMETYHTEPVKKMAEIFLKENFNPLKQEPETKPDENKFSGLTGSLEFNPLAMAHFIRDHFSSLQEFTDFFQQEVLNGNTFSKEECAKMKSIFLSNVLYNTIAEENYRKLLEEAKEKKHFDLPYSRYSSLMLDAIREMLTAGAQEIQTNLAKKDPEEQIREKELADSYLELALRHNGQLQEAISQGNVPLVIIEEARWKLREDLQKREEATESSEASETQKAGSHVDEDTSQKAEPLPMNRIMDIVHFKVKTPAILAPIGVPEPFISKDFYTDSKEVRKFKDLKQIMEKDLHEASPQQLFEFAQLGHPTDFGFKVSRAKVLEIFEEKGEEILISLGYPVDRDYPYVNINSSYKSVDRLNDIVNEYGERNKWWSAVEHYRPVGDMQRALKHIEEKLREEKERQKEFVNPSTGKPKGKKLQEFRDIDYDIREFKKSKRIIENYLKKQPENSQSHNEDIQAESKLLKEKSQEEIQIPLPKGSQCRASITLEKSKGAYRYGLHSEKKFGDMHGGGYAASMQGKSYADRSDALKAALLEIRKKFLGDLHTKDTILNNEETKKKRLDAAIKGLEAFAVSQGIDLNEAKKAEAPKEILGDLESAYWREEDEAYPENKITVAGVIYNQVRLRSCLLKKFSTLSIEEQLSLAERIAQQFGERKSLSTYEKEVKLDLKGHKAKSVALQAYLDGMVIHHDLLVKKEGVLTSLLTELFQGGEKLIDFPQGKTEIPTPIKKAEKKRKNQHEVNKEIETLIDAKDKAGASFSAVEKTLLADYTGSGGLMKQGATGRGVLYEYYTPDEIVRKMWGLAHKYGYEKGRILEPACGIGNFLKYAPKDEIVFGFETNHYSARIAQVLYPNFHIHEKAFESLFFAGNVHLKDDFENIPYSLIIGNPPYGEFTGKYAGMGEKKWTGATEYEQYFILRCLDLLAPKGLLIFIIPSAFLENKEKFNKIKEKILQKAELIDAYRLPTRVFDTTDIGTDIVVFRKK